MNLSTILATAWSLFLLGGLLYLAYKIGWYRGNVSGMKFSSGLWEAAYMRLYRKHTGEDPVPENEETVN